MATTSDISQLFSFVTSVIEAQESKQRGSEAAGIEALPPYIEEPPPPPYTASDDIIPAKRAARLNKILSLAAKPVPST